jgi:hypothetical protein
MSHPSTTREALIVEALGDAAKLIRQVEALAPALDRSRQALADAHRGLAQQLASFEAQVLAQTEKSKAVAVKHVLARSELAARQSIDLQSRAMTDAARVAFGAEIGAALTRLKALHDRPEPRWEPWLINVAAVTAGAVAGWGLAVATLWVR